VSASALAILMALASGGGWLFAHLIRRPGRRDRTELFTLVSLAGFTALCALRVVSDVVPPRWTAWLLTLVLLGIPGGWVLALVKPAWEKRQARRRDSELTGIKLRERWSAWIVGGLVYAASGLVAIPLTVVTHPATAGSAAAADSSSISALLADPLVRTGLSCLGLGVLVGVIQRRRVIARNDQIRRVHEQWLAANRPDGGQQLDRLDGR
jgi:predicted permease